MISITTLIALALIAGSIILTRKIYSNKDDEKIDASSKMQLDSDERCIIPDAREWCKTLEKLCKSAVFCFDESYRLAALGDEALKSAIDAKSQAQQHLVDIAPSSACSDLLEMMATARRKTWASKEVNWNGSIMHACVTPVGKRWMIVCIKKLEVRS
ncbi:MAG: hypothetical protein ABH871_06175 [Pseudomonadota bacterium]